MRGIGAGIGIGGKMKNKSEKKYTPGPVRPVCQDRLLGKGSKARPMTTTLLKGVDAGMGKGHGIAMGPRQMGEHGGLPWASHEP
ncbi:hypothetical protein N7517_003669 [Penicillium concentricum]|uniref:Uncharacterized protein n=1 Tax=Penicillium concentricum TaxID=293559 RepID=A0A9W9V7E2_9EURO|nr:uncharacterized protein N7517_003669 [Penicillium concentricum]KAJ5371663.1 hypothetical protein N7517_003669 [Penicillium concentricum]